MTIHYPWPQLERGQGFFVPCLDVERIREEGLREAVKYKLKDARAVSGIHRGLIGVMFSRGILGYFPPV
jgi:hypothetical protein